MDLHIVLVGYLLKAKKDAKNQRNMRFRIYIYQNQLDKACF